MANNRLIAVCVHPSHERPYPRKTIMVYFPSLSWCGIDNGNDGFLEEHQHYTLWGNYIVFVPEIRGIEELNEADDSEVAILVARLLHGDMDAVCE